MTVAMLHIPAKWILARWRLPAVALSAGACQAPAFIVDAFLMALAGMVGARVGLLDGFNAAGLFLPLVAAVLGASGDLIGGRPLVLRLTEVTLSGVGLTVIGGLLAEHAAPLATIMVSTGVFLMSAAARQGALVNALETYGLTGDDELTRSRALRQVLVLGPALTWLGAALISSVTPSALWVFGPVLMVLVGARILLGAAEWPEDRKRDRGTRGELDRRAFFRGVRQSFTDPWLLFASAGVFLFAFVTFGYFGGMTRYLEALGYTARWTGLVAAAGGFLAALLVGGRATWSSARFARVAGLVPVVGLAAISVITLATGAPDAGRFNAQAVTVIVFVGSFALASGAAELTKQWSQSIGQLFAGIGADEATQYRRLTVVHLGANLGAIAGKVFCRPLASVSRHAGGGQRAAVGLRLLGFLLIIAMLAWMAQRAWIRCYPRPWRLRVYASGRERWCIGGDEVVVVEHGLWTAIYEASPSGDSIVHARLRAIVHYGESGPEAELVRLRPEPGRLWSVTRRARALPREGARAALARGLRLLESHRLLALTASIQDLRTLLGNGRPSLPIRVVVWSVAVLEDATKALLDDRAAALRQLDASAESVRTFGATQLRVEERRLIAMTEWLRSSPVEMPDWMPIADADRRASRQLHLIQQELERRDEAR